ncbi:syntenin-2-like [Anopheles albimanus]|uniref:syntenin-2-like n=1 Tax=Anopheles albimanus TaxID=7167 RepID=UPI0016414C31|nr:syntenin-2-like [Anopheles albimanus]
MPGNPLCIQIENPSLDGTSSPRKSIITDDNAAVPQQNEATILRWQSSARQYARGRQQHDSELSNGYPPRYSVIMTEGFQNSNFMVLGAERSEHTISGIAPTLRGEPTHGIIRLTIRNCTDIRHVGLKVQAIDNGVFVSEVKTGSPADLAGLQFGDQILSIDRIFIAGYSRRAVRKLLRKIDRITISLVVRDRPYERCIMLQKDIPNCYGFSYWNGRIVSIVEGSSAATEGLQSNQQITCVNGQSAIGLTDRELWNLINAHDDGVSISIVPYNIYKRLTSNISLSGMLGSLKQALLNF